MDIDRSKIGVHALKLAVTLTRCPEGAPKWDEGLKRLAVAALIQLIPSLPGEIGGLTASLSYRGQSCSSGSVGYGPAWSRSSGG